MHDPSIIVAAAGSATRFGTDKLAAVVAGRTLLEWTLGIARRARPDAEVLCAARHPKARAEAARSVGATLLIVPDAARGLATTLTAALRACDPRSPGVVILLGDDPLAALAVGDVLDALGDGSRVVCCDRPDAPHPVYIPRQRFAQLAAAGEVGFRNCLDDRGAVRVPAVGESYDVDHPEQLEQLEMRLAMLA